MYKGSPVKRRYLGLYRRYRDGMVWSEAQMTVSEQERQKIEADLIAKQKRALSERMAALGRSRSPKKRRAVLKNIKKAQAAKRGKLMPAARRRESPNNRVHSG